MEWNEQLLICELPLHSASLVAGYGLYICGPTHSINCSLSFHPYSLSFFNGRQTSWLSAQHKKRWTGKPAGMKAIHKLLKWNGGAAEGRQPITHSFNNQSPALSCLHSWVGPAHCCFMNQRKFVCFLFIAEHCGVPPPLTHNSRKTNFLFIIHNQQRQRAANNFTFLFKKEEKFVVLLFAAAAAAMAPPKGADQPSQSINSNSIKQRKGMKWMKTNEGKSIMKATCLLEWLIAAASFGGMNGMVGPSAQGAAEALKLNGMRWNAEAWVGVPPAGHKPTNSTNFSFQFDFMALNEIKWRKVLICWSVEWVKKYYNSK